MAKTEPSTAHVCSLVPDFSFFFPQLVHHNPPSPSTLRHWHQIMHTVGCFSGKRCGAIVRTVQCLNGVAVMRIPACSLPLLKHGGRLCQPNKALVSNTKRHCGSSVVARSSSYHIESDGVTLVCSEVQLRSPRGILGVNLLHTAPLQARESAIISPCRWRGEGKGGASTPFRPLCSSNSTAGI